MKFYCPEPLTSEPLYPLFYFRFAPQMQVGGLFRENLPQNYFESAQYVEKPEEAQAIVLPNNFGALNEETRAYIAKYAALGEMLKKPVFIFACGDLAADLVFDPRVYVFRYSLYRSKKTDKDISTPTLATDLGFEGISLREKGETPTVSFCGKAGFSSLREAVASWVKRVPAEVEGIINPNARARIRGVFWRIWALKACRSSKLIKTLFIIRKSFSGAQQTIELDPAQARREFIESINDADFVLAPKGDGNYSNRFLEALSMGRIPVHIDTDAVLPFEDIIDYSKIMVRVPMHDIKNTPRYIRDFYDPLSSEEWASRQRMPRQAFERYLKQDVFFERVFSKLI